MPLFSRSNVYPYSVSIDNVERIAHRTYKVKVGQPFVVTVTNHGPIHVQVQITIKLKHKAPRWQRQSIVHGHIQPHTRASAYFLRMPNEAGVHVRISSPHKSIHVTHHFV